MSRDDDQRWKQKYLDNLEQQEKLERRWDARLDLLRRGLVRSSLAAEGSDKAVDACMKELREVLRRDEMDAGLSRLIPQLEKAVLDSEQRRQQRIEQNISALSQLSQQLLSLDMPGDVRKPLKRLAKDIPSRGSSSRELPALLGELSRLQRQVLDHFGNAGGEQRPGFLQRLFGSRDSDEADEPESLPSTAVATAAAAAMAPAAVDEPLPAETQSAAPAPASAEVVIAEAVAEPVAAPLEEVARVAAPEPAAAPSEAERPEPVAVAEVAPPGPRRRTRHPRRCPPARQSAGTAGPVRHAGRRPAGQRSLRPATAPGARLQRRGAAHRSEPAAPAG
jgi:hypothetical protein